MSRLSLGLGLHLGGGRGGAEHPITLGPELVTNGTFDTDLTGWSALLAPDVFEQNSGTMRIVNNVGTGRGLVGQTAFIAVTAGQAYAYEITLQVIAGSGPAISINQANYNASRLVITSDAIEPLTTFTGTFTASASENVHFIADFDDGQQRECRIDNVSLRAIL